MTLGLLEQVVRADSLLPATARTGIPLWAGPHNTPVGLIRPSLLPLLPKYPDVFEEVNSVEAGTTAIRLHPSLKSIEERTSALEKVFLDWRAKYSHLTSSSEEAEDITVADFKCLRGWRNERYAVAGDALKGEGDLLHCERAAAGLLGIRAYGCHLNGYVRDPQTRQLKMWTARRSPTKQTYPSMLDNLVGGGLAAGVNPRENIIKECYEEAGMTADFVKSRLQDVGAVTFFLVDEDRGWVPTTEYTYDIELDSDFQPHAIDGEVANFMLLLPDEVLQHLRNGEFTPEAGLVTIDFLTRLGVVTAANEPDYLEILTRMHRSLSAPGLRFGSS